MKTITCARCKGKRGHQARDLCVACYSWWKRNVDDGSPPPRAIGIMNRIEDLEFWAEAGVTLREAAEKLKIKRDSLKSWCLRTEGADHVLMILRENEMRWLGR